MSLLGLEKSRADVNPTQLTKEINADAGVIEKIQFIAYDEPAIKLYFVTLPGAPEEAIIDAKIAAHSNIDSLRAVCRTTVDEKTGELIALGFSHSSNTFSLSRNAQINWLGLDMKKAALTYPYEITTKDDLAYSIADQAELQTMIDKAFIAKETPIVSGRALKLSINVAADKDALNLIMVDNDNR